MTRYRTKPIEVEAIQYTGDNEREIADFMNVPVPALQTRVDAVLRADGNYRKNCHILINTLEGTMTANYGDYIIKGVKGEYYPCKPDIFDETYEIVEDEIKPRSYTKGILKLPEVTDADKEVIRKVMETNDTAMPIIQIHPMKDTIRDIGKVLVWLYSQGILMNGRDEQIEKLLGNITKEGEE